MANFDEMAKAAKADSQKIVDAEAAAKQAKLDAEEHRLAEAEAALQRVVLPILQEAADAFSKNGVEMKIGEAKTFRILSQSSGETIAVREINFHCFTRIDGTEHKSIKGDEYLFEHDGSSLTWKRFSATGAGQKFGGGTADSFVAPVIKMALESYHEKLRQEEARNKLR